MQLAIYATSLALCVIMVTVVEPIARNKYQEILKRPSASVAPLAQMIVTVLLFSLSYYISHGSSALIILGWTAVISALYGIVLIDMRYRIIPDRFHLIGTSGALCIVIGQYDEVIFATRTIGAILLFIVLWFISAIYGHVRKQLGLGLGDIKLFSWLTLVVGPHIISLIMISCLIGGIQIAIFACKHKYLKWRQGFAFAPCIGLATVFLHLFLD